jgi:hypothetical protein
VKVQSFVALAAAAVIFAGCSFESKNERLADEITKAVMANDLNPVMKDLTPGTDKKITRSEIANWSDELNGQGKLQSVKEDNANCDPGWHCFNVQFEKAKYTERMALDENGKVRDWKFHIAN